MAIYAKFNERAQRVLSVAQKEAQAMRHPYVGTEHLLLALVAGVLAWRSALGGIELYETRDVTSLLQIPLWLAFPIIVASFVLLALVSVLNLMTDMKGARA